jgi:hypothetical protein
MKVKQSWSLLLMVIITLSCSNLSKNNVQEGKLVLKNGVFADKSWKEDLVFQRNSWFHELTLSFDLMLSPFSPQSSFNFWFSKDELDTIIKCADARVAMAYSLDTKDIPYSALYEQLEKSGFTRFELIEFKKQILAHPDAPLNGFRLYHIFGICKKTEDAKPLIINLPGYLEKKIN